MYLDHFGLSEPPFRITPHTDFFFAGANRGATLEALTYAITHDEGIVKVCGEVGSGKTLLCRMLMERLPGHVATVYLANPTLGREDVLFAIVDELGIPAMASARPSAVLRSLQEHLVALYADGRQVVVLIDEAHAMPAESLEEIRLLSNLESNRHKLLQLVLFGQPELNETLARPDMRQLKDRITHNFALEPLVRDDIAQYLGFRMRAAGYKGPDVFTPAAIKLIAGASEGLTRRINILADKALLAAFAAGTHQITAREAKAAIHDSEFGQTRVGRQRQNLYFALAGAAIAAVAVTAGALLQYSRTSQTAPIEASRVSIREAPTPSSSDIATGPGLPAAPTQKDAAPEPPGVSSTPPAGTALPAHAAFDKRWPELGPNTRQLIAANRGWFATTADERWFVQLVRTDPSQAEHVEAIVASALKLLTPGEVRVYAIDLAGSRRLGVVYGDFASGAAATQAMRQLPLELGATAFPRQLKRLR